MRFLLSPLFTLFLVGYAQAQPNVIYIKTDDQRYDSLSMTGHPVTKTPHIDQLASEGVFFDQAFITSPICGPSRANTLSGQWERKNRVGFSDFHGNDMTREVFENSWLMCLKRAGYTTAYIGKNHVNVRDGKNKKVMSESLDFAYMHKGHIGFNLERWDTFNNLKNKTQVEGLLEATEAFLNPSEEKEYFYQTAHHSVKDFLSRRDENKPFALSVNINLPHASSIGGMGSGQRDPEYYKSLYEEQKGNFLYPEGFLSGQEPLPEKVFQLAELMGYYQYNSERGLLDNMLKMARANYAIDRFVGTLREQLTTLGIADNTIIVFASDHGLLLGEKGLGGKSFLYEDSVRIPLIVYAPALAETARGQIRDELVVGQDIPATILELCGVEVPASYQGKSLVPLITGQRTQWRKDIFLENLFTMQGYPRMEAVRSHEWKYIRYFSKEHDRKQYLPDASINGEQPIYEELFHLWSDPEESENLASDPQHAETLQRYRERCQTLVTELAQ